MRANLEGLNAGYVAQLLEDYLDSPGSVPTEWRTAFESDDAILDLLPGLRVLLEARANGAPVSVGPPVVAPPELQAAPAPAEVDETLLGGVAAAMALVKAYRMHGHLAARLDPLGSEPTGDPALDETRLVPALTPELQARIPARLLRLYVAGDTLLEALPRLREVYCGSSAYEIEHISDHAERVWLRQAIESGRFREPLTPDQQIALLRRLSQVEGLEQYLRKSFLGQKQFSLEGLDVLVPMLDETIEIAAADGAHEIVIGMAHRGRLNVLCHTVGRSYESILREVMSSTTSLHLGRARRRRARSRSRCRRTRATSRRSIRSSKVERAPSRPIAPGVLRSTIPRSRCLCSSTATPHSPARALWRRRSTCRASRATRPAAHFT